MKESNLSIHIRPPKPEEYSQVVECIRDARGLDYYDPKFYDPNYLCSGEHELFAAFDDNGVMTGVTGISAAPFETEKSMLSLLNIRPVYTGHGIGSALLRYTVDLLQSRGTKAIKGQVVTRYTSIQKVLEGLGLQPTGVLYGIRDGRNTKPRTPGKCGLAIYVRNLNIIETKKLYVHDDIIKPAENVYSNFGVSLSFGIDAKSEPFNEVDRYYDAHDNVLFTQVKKSSCNLAESLDDSAAGYRFSKDLTELVFLNLCSPSAVCGYESLKNNGYNFSGFNPFGDYESVVFYKGGFQSVALEKTGRLKSLISKINEVGNNDNA